MSKDKNTEKVGESKKKVVVVEEIETPKEESKQEEVKQEELKQEEKPQSESQQIIGSESEVATDEDKPNYLWIIIPTALLVGALVGGLITYFSGISKLSDGNTLPSPVATIKPDTEPIPTASPSSSFKRSDIKLQVLNGSGISGLAGKAKTYLEGLGYLDVVVGNASESNLTDTVISVKDSKKEFLETIKSDLVKKYQLAKEAEVLPTSSKYDFVITLGNK